MAITDAQFMYVVVDLLAALDTLGVPYTAETFDGGLPADQLINGLASMQGDIVTDPAGDTVLFNQIGGQAAVQAVVTEFISVVGADTRINGFFAESDLDALNGLLVEQICEATGGYCTYSGRSMCDTHAGMGVTDDAFDALVGDLLIALENLEVPYALDGTATIDPLLFALVGMHDEIVDPQVGCATSM
jgi:hemoglobin